MAFFNISVVIFTLVAMAFDRYCTVVPNVVTKTVNKHRNKRWFIFTVSYESQFKMYRSNLRRSFMAKVMRICHGTCHYDYSGLIYSLCVLGINNYNNVVYDPYNMDLDFPNLVFR